MALISRIPCITSSGEPPRSYLNEWERAGQTFAFVTRELTTHREYRSEVFVLYY